MGSGFGLTMTRNGSVTTFWADGEYTFRLAIGQLRELQEKTGVGPYKLYERLIRGEWRADDVREAIRLGLIGGGLKPADAHKLVGDHFDQYGMPLIDHVPAALEIMAAALIGPDDEPLGKDEPVKAKRKSARTRKGGSSSRTSTGTVAPLAGG